MNGFNSDFFFLVQCVLQLQIPIIPFFVGIGIAENG